MLISCCDHITLPFFLLRVCEKKHIHILLFSQSLHLVCFLIFHPNATLTTKDIQRQVCIRQFVKWQYMKIVLQGQCQNCKSVSFWTQNLSSLAPACNKYIVQSNNSGLVLTFCENKCKHQGGKERKKMCWSSNSCCILFA